MDEPIKCECGNNNFWFFGDYVRCTKCYIQYRYNKRTKELWLQRYNKIEKKYKKNYERGKIKEGDL